MQTCRFTSGTRSGRTCNTTLVAAAQPDCRDREVSHSLDERDPPPASFGTERHCPSGNTMDVQTILDTSIPSSYPFLADAGSRPRQVQGVIARHETRTRAEKDTAMITRDL